MSYVVIVRIQGGPLVGIQEESDGLPALKEWSDPEIAKYDMEAHILGNQDFEVVEVKS